MRTVVLLFVGVACAVAHAADAPKPDEKRAEVKLWATISTNVPIIDRSNPNIGKFTVFFGLVNDGTKTLDPKIEKSKLLVNGKEMKEWDFIISNGLREQRWTALPPGDYLNFAYPMGDQFKEPGEYHLVWKGTGYQSQELVFRVMPEPKKK